MVQLHKASIALVLMFVLSSCGVNWHLKQAKKHLDKAIAMGAKVDTLTTVVYDTVFSVSFRDRIPTSRLVNTTVVVDLCRDLLKTNLNKNAKTEIVNRIAKTVCPEVALDTTYNIELFAQGGKYILPITVKINASGTHHDYSIKAGELKIPVKVETNQVNIETPRGFWFYLLWIGLPCSLIFFAAGFLIRSGSGKNILIDLRDMLKKDSSDQS